MTAKFQQKWNHMAMINHQNTKATEATLLQCKSSLNARNSQSTRKQDYHTTCTTCKKNWIFQEVYMPRRFSTELPDEITVVHQGDNQTLCFWVAPVIQDHPPGLNIWFKLKPNNKSTFSICKTHFSNLKIMWTNMLY